MMSFSSRLVAKAARGCLVALTLGCWHAALAAESLPASDGDTDIINEVMSRVERDYVRPVQPGQLVHDALKGMLAGLDPHSAFMDEKEYRRLMSDANGQFVGVGLEITEKNDVPSVISPIDGTPAAQAGVEAGDMIAAVDGQRTVGMNLDDVVDMIRGAPQTQVTLTIVRNDQPPFDVKITRALIHVVSIKSALEPDKIGYARITNFAENTQSELTGALHALSEKAGGRLNGFVLDLRNDPGGLLDAAVAVAGDFVDGGTVVSTRGRVNGETRNYRASSDGDLLGGIPMVVLINSASASASEIVAGALKDHHRATLMGTRSFGKGSVQTIVPLDGHGALRLTTALYYTPAGQSIQDIGITPDVVVPVPQDEAVANALVTREADLRGAIKNPTPPQGGSHGGPVAENSPEMSEDRPIQNALIGTPRDAQLSEAVKFIHQKIASRRTMLEGQDRPIAR
jgi:carboxyl-terminal processing protease